MIIAADPKRMGARRNDERATYLTIGAGHFVDSDKHPRDAFDAGQACLAAHDL
jgi:hypothetical protein